MTNKLILSDALPVLRSMPGESVDLVYTDPPFGTGVTQSTQRRVGSQVFDKMGYSDRFEDYMGFLVPHLEALHAVLKPTGSLYLHLDPRWSHRAKVECDRIFGQENFLNEIIWSYNFGGRGKDRWPSKHDVILFYVKSRGKHTFNWDQIDRIPYAAPEMQSVGRSKEDAAARVALGQVPTDVWQMSIVGTNSKERTGYPSQKPGRLIKRVVIASSNVGDLILDPFCGSGTTGVVAFLQDRQFTLIDKNPQAIAVTSSRLTQASAQFTVQQGIPT